MKKLAVEFHNSVQDDDGVRSAVAVRLSAQPRRIADEVVLGAGAGILVQQPSPTGRS
jgi:hypothetical protein